MANSKDLTAVLPVELYNELNIFLKYEDKTILALTNKYNYWKQWNDVGCYTKELETKENFEKKFDNDFIIEPKIKFIKNRCVDCGKAYKSWMCEFCEEKMIQ